MKRANPDGNPDQLLCRLTGPDGRVMIDETQKVVNAAVTLEVKDAPKGVYTLRTASAPSGGMVTTWLESSLPQAVVATGEQGVEVYRDVRPITDAKTGQPRDRAWYERDSPADFQCSVPRRRWFWVPADVTKFTAAAIRDNAISQREDWGFFIITPRGQRIRALWASRTIMGTTIRCRRWWWMSSPARAGVSGAWRSASGIRTTTRM